MEDMKKETLSRAASQMGGLTHAEVEEIVTRIMGMKGGVVPPAPPGTPGPEVLIHPGERIVNKDQLKLLDDMAATLPPSAESGWKSRKVWVAIVTLVGMLAQIPLDKRLSPQELIAVACVAVAYISWQACVDIAKVRAREPRA